MKRCPRCNQTFDDATDFCVDDGALLEPVSTGEKSPSRIVVSLEEQQLSGETPTQHTHTSIPQQASNPQTTPNNSNLLYAVIGGLVAVILIGGAYLFLFWPREKENEKARIEPSNISTNSNQANISNNGNNATGGERDHTATNSGVDPMNANVSRQSTISEKKNTKKDGETPQSDQKAIPLAKGYNAWCKSCNGRVIMMNAIVRSSPSVDAPGISVISFNEPIKIGRSAGGNSPWFRVTTTSGMTGWMHGNTIEFVR